MQNEQGREITLHLGDPLMTLLHRAGLAGLWMTLRVLEKKLVERPCNFEWSLTRRSVTLRWEGKDVEVLDWLLKQAFQLRDGLISFTGVSFEDLDPQTLTTLHQGMRGTFLQHPSTYTAAGTTKKAFMVEEGIPEIVISYQILTSYIHREFAENLCDGKGKLAETPFSVAGWLNPGAVVRHVAFSGQTGFEETAPHALLLLFAPVACQFFLLRSRLRDKRAQFAVVIPEVTDLENHADRRWRFLNGFALQDFQTSSLGDAGLRFLTRKRAAELAREGKVERCQVVTFGTVAWSSQQKSRTEIHVIEATEETCRNYETAAACFPDRLVAGKDGSFIASSFARELIAENLAKNASWFHGISEHVASGERFKQLSYEREGLHQMVQHAQWNDETEKLFVRACHEALRNTYAKVFKRAREKGEVPNIDRENERFRTSLGRCKNADTFREFITDFWSRAGQVPTLQDHWKDLLLLVTGKQSWRMAKDLALLALASYKKAEAETEIEVFD